MKKNIKKNIKKHSGITLIALVITIVVLLILAGVSIAMLTGDNGILTQANEAKKQNEIAKEKEEINVAYAGAKAMKVEKIGENVTASELNNELQKLNSKGTAKGSTTLTVIFENGHIYKINQGNGEITGPVTGEEGGTEVEGVIIPEGFYYVGGTKDEGIVISDNIVDKDKGTSHEVAKTLVGNQFVWVPVENKEDFVRYPGYYDGELQIEGWPQFEWCEEPNTSGYQNEAIDYEKMKESVLKYKGFYVGRYEAGTNNAERNEESGINDDVIIKQGANVYNYIKWSKDQQGTLEEGGAFQKSKEFAKENGYLSVTSHLLYGVEWDAIMAWIDPAYKTGTCDINNSFVANADGKGNYSGNLLETGSNANYAVKNIYDLAGNGEELTNEVFVDKYYKYRDRICRGGNALEEVNERISCSSYRALEVWSGTGKYAGFRIALYLNT